jgi:hypothetical protein
MQTGTVPALALATVLLVAGCAGAPGSGTPMPDNPSVAAATTVSPTATPTPAPLGSLPAPSRCLTDAAPRPDAVDGVEPSAYPEPPETLTREGVVGWLQSFEIAYYRNAILADEPGDEELNLTRVSAYAEVRSVNHTAAGYTVRFGDSGATNFESDVHGDYGMDVGYVVNETHLIRIPLDDRDSPIRANAGTVVVGCE